MPVSSILRMLRQNDYEFEANLHYINSVSYNNNRMKSMDFL